jgi:hypothetical protein
MVSVGMSDDAHILSDDPAVLKAMIAALQAENARMSATLQAHEQLVQALRLRIAKLQKQAFGKSSEKDRARDRPAGAGAGGSAGRGRRTTRRADRGR